jgi:hypothetical protein
MFMIIYQKIFDETILQRIRLTIRQEPNLSRSALSRLVCEWLEWRSPNGKLKDMSCRKALQKLDAHGLIELPKARKNNNFSIKRPKYPLPPISDITCDLSDLGHIEVIAITNSRSEDSRAWNAIMDEYHYLGRGPLCGAQIRYIVKSSVYGIVGGLSFSAAAWKLKARDYFIGWDSTMREERLNHVLSNSRFLICPSIKVKNLASHILSQALKRLSADWVERYHVTPVLVETFVDSDKYLGICYKAANWHLVGMTAGRGRQDTKNKRSLSRKHIYLYPLKADWRKTLGGTPEPLEDPNKKERPKDWIEQEFESLDLGDDRLNKRLQLLAKSFHAQPGVNLPQACGNVSELKAAYRFLDNKRVNIDALLEPHYKSTQTRLQQEPVILAAQDTSSLNYTNLKACKGLGLLSSKSNGNLGLQLHDTMAFTPEGVPLGLIDIQCWARDLEGKKGAARKSLPIEEKESYKWLKSYHATAAIQEKCPDTMFVSVGDRESDLYELFAETHKFPSGPKLLIRGERTRMRNTSEGYLWDLLENKAIAGTTTVQVPRSGNRPQREAQLNVRFAEVTLRAPLRKNNLPEIKAWGVYAKEENPAEGTENPLEWLLITTVPTNDFMEAKRILSWYEKRWGIEEYHRTLKSGCKIELRQLRDVERIKACLAIDLVIAWRILYLSKSNRVTPEAPANFFLMKKSGKP